MTFDTITRMQKTPAYLKYMAIMLALVLVATACSSGGSESDASSDADVAGESESDVESGSEAETIDAGDPVGSLRALASADSPISVAYSTGINLDVADGDSDIEIPILPNLPSFVETIDESEGVIHTRMDVGTGAAVWAERFLGLEVARFFADIDLQLWESGGDLIIDTTAFEALVPVGTSLGPFEPDVWSLDRPELKPSLIAQTAAFGPFIDSNVLRASEGSFNFAVDDLPNLIESAQLTDADGALTGTVPYGELVEIMGIDLTQTLLSALFPIEESLPGSDQQIAAMDFLVDFAESTSAQITAGPLVGNPSVTEVTVAADLSEIYERIAGEGIVDLGATEGAVEGAILEVTHNFQIGLSPVFPPVVPADVVDRSEEFAGVQ